MENINRYSCNLSSKLYKSERIYEQKLGNRWVIFIPDYEGMPIIISQRVHKILNLFKKGLKISEAILLYHRNNYSANYVGEMLSTISLLHTKRFLRNSPNKLPYTPYKNENSYPKSIGVWLHITNECNLNCSYCFVKNHSKITMDIKTFQFIAQALIETAKKYNINQIHLKFAGGEPTLKLTLIEKFIYLISEKAERNNIEIFYSILSNGTILNEQLIRLLKQPKCGIGISIDGYGEIHNTFRKFRNSDLGSWKKIEQNISILKQNGILPYIMSTISKETADSLPELTNWIFSNQMKTRLNIVRETNCSWQNQSSTIIEYKNMCDLMINAFDKSLALLENSSFKIDLIDGLGICELHFDKPAKGVICGIGKNHLVVKPNGKIVSCPMLIDEEGIKPSHNLIQSIRKTFPYSPFSKKTLNKIENDCLYCLWYPVCCGECPIINNWINGYPFTKSPMCDFFQFIIPRFIQFYAKKLIQQELME